MTQTLSVEDIYVATLFGTRPPVDIVVASFEERYEEFFKAEKEAWDKEWPKLEKAIAAITDAADKELALTLLPYASPGYIKAPAFRKAEEEYRRGDRSLIDEHERQIVTAQLALDLIVLVAGKYSPALKAEVNKAIACARGD